MKADQVAARCLEPDGSHRQVNLLIKYELLFPESFQHVRTRYQPALVTDRYGQQLLILEVELTALNAFGQRVRGQGYGEVVADTCAAADGGLLE